MSVFEYYESQYLGDIYYDNLDLRETFIEELINGEYNFDKSDIFDFIKASLWGLFIGHRLDTLMMILESEYWQVFEPDWNDRGLVHEYCYRHYSYRRTEFMELLCQKINFSNSLHLIEECYNMNMKKRTYSEMECGYKLLDRSNVYHDPGEYEYVLDEDFYDFIKNKYYSSLPIVYYSNKRKC